jgi:hypothetical protein
MSKESRGKPIKKAVKIYRRIFTAARGRETRQEKLKPYLQTSEWNG